MSVLMCAVNLHEAKQSKVFIQTFLPHPFFLNFSHKTLSKAGLSNRTLSDGGNVLGLCCLPGASETEELDFEFESTLTRGTPTPPNPLDHCDN